MSASRRSLGVSGSAALVGAAGLYLAYVGLKDVPFFEGLGQLLRKQVPTPRDVHSPYTPENVIAGIGDVATALNPRAGDGGVNRLVGNAAKAYPSIRKIAPGIIYGWGIRSDLSSDHPKGLAMDVMLRDDPTAQKVIAKFRSQPGAKYWIWNRQIANRDVDNWRIRPYSGASPHTDHVHLSFD